jgi:hypothetical protein
MGGTSHVDARPERAATDVATYCERCGTRYVASPAPRPALLDRLERARIAARPLAASALSRRSVVAALTAARRELRRRQARRALDAFRSLLKPCPQCRLYSCRQCWNSGAARCLACAPRRRLRALAVPLGMAPALGVAGRQPSERQRAAAHGVAGLALLAAAALLVVQLLPRGDNGEGAGSPSIVVPSGSPVDATNRAGSTFAALRTHRFPEDDRPSPTARASATATAAATAAATAVAAAVAASAQPTPAPTPSAPPPKPQPTATPRPTATRSVAAAAPRRTSATPRTGTYSEGTRTTTSTRTSRPTPSTSGSGSTATPRPTPRPSTSTTSPTATPRPTPTPTPTPKPTPTPTPTASPCVLRLPSPLPGVCP